MGLKDLFRKVSEKNRKFKEMEEDYRLNKTLEERQKSPQERELEKFMEKERQKKIKYMLDKFHKKERDEYWRGGMGKSKNIFKGHANILHNKKIFGMKGNMLKAGQL